MASRGLSRAFTLIEVLVALAILAIALMAALRAAGQGSRSAEEMRARLLAGWVAQNVLETQRARGDWPSVGLVTGDVAQAGLEFSWREEVVSTPNAAFRRVNIAVSRKDAPEYVPARITGVLVGWR